MNVENNTQINILLLPSANDEPTPSPNPAVNDNRIRIILINLSASELKDLTINGNSITPTPLTTTFEIDHSSPKPVNFKHPHFEDLTTKQQIAPKAEIKVILTPNGKTLICLDNLQKT